MTPDTRAAAVERRAAAQRATLRNARACTALRHSQRASARRIALRVLAAADAIWDGVAAYAPHALQNAVLLCTNGQIGVLRQTRDVAVLDAGHTGCDVRFYCGISICVGGDSDLAQTERSGRQVGDNTIKRSK